MSTLLYKLYLSGIDQNGPAAIVNGATTKVTYGGVAMKLSLYAVSFSRQFYEPGHIQAEIMIRTASSVQLGTLRSMLVGKDASLSVGDTSVASNYYIHEITPRFESVDSDNCIYVKLDIFSKDKKLQRNKYSRAYLGRKLVENIVPDILTIPGGKVDVTLRPSGSSVLQNLEYTSGSSKAEYIHPYLVQYNESAYDFLVRITNRCGEALYFENGMLCIGLSKTPETPTPIEGAKSVIFQNIADPPFSVRDYARDSVKEYRYDSSSSKYTYDLEKNDILTDPVEKNDKGFPTDAFPEFKNTDFPYVYNSELASEDQYMILYKDKFARDDYGHVLWGDTAQRLMIWLSEILNATTLLELITKFTQKGIEALIKSGQKAGDTNDKGNKVLKDASLNGNENDKYAILFSKVDNVKDHWVSLDYYHDIRAYEEQQMQKAVCIDMGDSFIGVNLGEQITVPNDDQATYVVTRIDMVSGDSWQRTYNDGPQPEAVQTQRIYAIPFYGNGSTSKFYPPLLPIQHFRKSGPQPAFITDAGDLASQGRVRVRFPWQPSINSFDSPVATATQDQKAKKTELEKYATFDSDGNPTKKSDVSQEDYDNALKQYNDATDALTYATERQTFAESATPWIRMATPMATPGGGMYFKPEVGDEVMVDFENGNVDRPYVVGTLYSKNVPAPNSGSRVIVSRNGHTIKMTDPTNAVSLASGMYPGFKFMESYGLKPPCMEGAVNTLLGGIELTDKFGIYNIKMSSHDRNITISSPFGNINVNAFTGISINAPNGDISITGKNVEISAHNNLKLTSGKNIKSALGVRYGLLFHDGAFANSMRDASAWGKTLSKMAISMSVGNFLDLSLLRSIVEIVARPLDGTLQVKSNRYLLLEAGEGKAADVAPNYDKPADVLFSYGVKDQPAQILVNLLNEVKTRMNDYVTEFVQKFSATQAALTLQASDFDQNAKDKISTPATIDDLVKKLFDLCDKADPDNQISDFLDEQSPNSHIVFTDNTDPVKKSNFNGIIRGLFNAVCSLKTLANKYEDLLTLTEADKTGISSQIKVKINQDLSDVLDKLVNKNDIKTILTLNDPVLPNPGNAAVNPGNNLVAPDPKIDGQNASGLYAEYIKKISDFKNNGQASFFTNKVLNASTFDAWKSAVLRRLACYMIEQCRGDDSVFKAAFQVHDMEYSSIQTIDKNGKLSTTTGRPSDMKEPFRDNDWSCYVSDIRLEPGKSTKILNEMLSGAKTSIGEMALKLIPRELAVWKFSSKGQILFSDKKNETYRFNNGITEHYLDPDPVLSFAETDLKTLLMTF